MERIDVISMRDFSKEQIISILDVAADVKKALHDSAFHEVFREKYGYYVNELLKELKVATLFLENSTRTNHSFRAAVLSGGGSFDGFPSANYTSLKKGETWADTAAMFAGYGYDAIVMRSTTEGLPRWTKHYLKKTHALMQYQHHKLGLPFSSLVPMIVNGGDGKNQHPTQCFLDLFTMREIAKAHDCDLEGLNLALLNDLAHGRTNASLMSVAHHFNFTLHLAYPPRFGPQTHRLEMLKRNGVQIFDYQHDFKMAMRNSFIAYHSRPQKERVGEGEDLISIKKLGQINRKIYDELGENAPYLMHPLPVDADTFEEIAADMREHPLNITKLQSSNGLPVRIALLAIGLGRIKNILPDLTSVYGSHIVRLVDLSLKEKRKELINPRSGYIENNGIVLDHIPAGIGRRLAGILGLEKNKIPKVISDYIPVNDGKQPFKDIIKIHQKFNLGKEHYEAIALVAPDISLSFVENGQVVRKVRPVLGTMVKSRVKCGNPDCVTNIEKEHVNPRHYILDDRKTLECYYCEHLDSIQKIYEENRFIYL